METGKSCNIYNIIKLRSEISILQSHLPRNFRHLESVEGNY